MKRGISNEPIVYLPFSGGGMMAALFVPIHLLLFTLLIPLGVVEAPAADTLLQLVQNPIAKVYLFVLIGGCLFHWAHRFRYTLIDLGIHGARQPIALLCYGSAIVGTLWGGMVVFGA
jgi:fumarate reductase subunit D